MSLFRCLALFAVLTLASRSHAAITLLSPLAHESTLAAGEAFEGTILLRNNGTETATARVFQTDYRFTADGSNDFGRAGVSPRSNARWFEVSTSLVTLAPGQTASVRYRGRVPASGELSGTYWSIVMIEDSMPVPGANGVSTVTRYGVQVATQIGDSGTRSVRFGSRRTETENGNRVAFLELENDGQRLVFPRVWVELFDAAGARIGRFGGEVTRLYPGCSSAYRAALGQVPAGTYRALILADCGDDQIVGMQCELVL